jgi:hypothetical protein
MFGLSMPTPSTITSNPMKNRRVSPAASEPLPSMISTPPQTTERCCPINRSAIHPPIGASRYVAAMYRP